MMFAAVDRYDTLERSAGECIATRTVVLEFYAQTHSVGAVKVSRRLAFLSLDIYFVSVHI